MLSDGGELAVLDVREELTYSEGHLLHARTVPLSRLELRVATLVPRLATRIVLCDANEGLAAKAAEILLGDGYTDVSILEGGIAAWAADGFELFSGVNVPSKAFGEFVEHECGTPSVDAAQLDRLLKEKADIVVVDSRPFDEYQRVSIPGATSLPGAELVFRIRDLVPSPKTTVVVNCAGRTRSIIGAQSLINAGLPNKVVALRNGSMGWSLAGLECESGRAKRAPDPSNEGRAWARQAAERVADRHGVRRIDQAALDRMRSEATEHTLYLLDVRDPGEFERGHLPGALSAPGGQLVQATDQYVGTLGARLILVDDAEVRALMTASWLVQMGWTEVFVLAAAGSETGIPAAKVLGNAQPTDSCIEPLELSNLIEHGDATIVDLSLSRAFRKGHIPGAWFAIRSRLSRAFANIAFKGSTLVLTSEDGILAGLAVTEARSLTDRSVKWLAGGNAAWKAAGNALEAGEDRLADAPVDVWLKPYERPIATSSAMSEYLSWEVDLVERIKRDGTCNFHIR